VQRLRDVKNKCYSLVLDDRQLADLTFQGLFSHLKDKYASQEFESLSHFVAEPPKCLGPPAPVIVLGTSDGGVGDPPTLEVR